MKFHTFPVRAGMFMELVAKPMPKAIDDSTPRNLATNCSSSSWISRFPGNDTSQFKYNFPAMYCNFHSCLMGEKSHLSHKHTHKKAADAIQSYQWCHTNPLINNVPAGAGKKKTAN